MDLPFTGDEFFALLVHPLPGCAMGHRYPAVPTFGLPCPTTIFTIGTLLFAKGAVPRSVLVVPVLCGPRSALRRRSRWGCIRTWGCWWPA